MTANNHSLDRGKSGLERTIQLIDSLKVPHAGTYINADEREKKYPLLLEKNGFRIALLNYERMGADDMVYSFFNQPVGEEFLLFVRE